MPLSRRDMLWRVGGGFAGLALAHLLRQDHLLAGDRPLPHFAPRAKRVIQLFMNGGVSPMDTFDHKPRLAELHGQRFDPGGGQLVESVTNSPGFKVLKSPFEFRRHGQSGRWVSSVFPAMAKIVDELTFVMSMASKSNVHGLASYMQNTGFVLPGFPAMGAWISYGLGRLNDNLPAFVVMPDPRGLPYNNEGNFSAGFLPASHQGTVVRASSATPIDDLWPGDSRLEARIESYELAARMQSAAPEVFDLSKEPEATKRLYGLDQKVTEEFGKRCLIARRMIERGVRFVQLWSGPSGPTKN